jgi:hypothetical protein
VTGTGGGTADGGKTCGGCTTSTGLCLEVTNNTNCGINGSTCTACATGEYCTDGVCAAGDAGILPGAVGTTCTIDADCSAVPKTSTFPAFCKKQTLTGNASYAGGYCTRRCTQASDCGSSNGVPNVCTFFLGPNGEPDNLCLQGCGTAASQCRAGYGCYNFGSQAMPEGGCWLRTAAGNPPDVFDAGPGNPGNAGSACTTDRECGAAPFFGCNTAELPDGGPTGFPGGQCTGNCSLTINDNWCGDAGVCLPGLFLVDNLGPLVQWTCSQSCKPGVAGACRTGYVCEPFNATFASCSPDCRNNAATWCAETHGSTSTCDSTTGLCK